MLNLLKNLVNAKSTCDVGELHAAKVLADYLQGNGIGCNLDVWDDNRANVFACLKGTNPGKGLILLSHLE